MRTKIKESQLDKVFSLWIRHRDQRCLKCGIKENLQCAHIFSRTARSVRWDPLNAITLCYRDHLYWAHKNPIEFTEFIQHHLGEKNYSLLKQRYYRVKQWTQKEKKILFKKYSSFL